VTRLAARGDVVFLADVDVKAGTATAADLVREGLDVRYVHLDVRQSEQIASVVTDADARVPLGTVVNNAGIGWSRRIVDTTAEQFDSLMAVNLRGTFLVLQAAARVMIPRRHGCVVNVASTSAFTASTNAMVPYDTSKGAVRMMTIAAARELASEGVRVNAVAPGTVETDLTRSLVARDGDLERLADAHIPLGRLGRPDEIAAAVDFLSSDNAAYVTGHVLVVDGGWLT
jgi:NAD(P)-dependent dehydrogenase (short-subunit alcohol dehydrogenase family)